MTQAHSDVWILFSTCVMAGARTPGMDQISVTDYRTPRRVMNEPNTRGEALQTPSFRTSLNFPDPAKRQA